MRRIVSRDNPQYKAVKKLVSDPRALRALGLCVLEGEHLVRSYVAACGVLPTLWTDAPNDSLASEVFVVPEAFLAPLSALATAPTMIGIAPVPKPTPAVAPPRFVLALDAVQDPANLGALIRSAAAAGVDAVWCGLGSAYAWSGRALRASQGHHFMVRVETDVPLVERVARFQGDVLVAMLESAKDLYATDLRGAMVLVVGNEGAGVAKEIQALATGRIRIPMARGAESLNVAAATAVILYESVRQRTCADRI